MHECGSVSGGKSGSVFVLSWVTLGFDLLLNFKKGWFSSLLFIVSENVSLIESLLGFAVSAFSLAEAGSVDLYGTGFFEVVFSLEL